MRVLVTGGLGWTALAILSIFRRAGHDIAVLDLPDVSVSADHAQYIDDLMPGSVSDMDSVNAAMIGVDAVVHLAVAIGDGVYGSSELPFATNVQGTYNVFAAARQNNVKKIVLMSEAAVHVKHHAPVIRATDPLVTAGESREEHLYDLTKHLQESIARNYAATFQMPIVVLRPGHIVDGIEGVDPKGRPLTDLQYLRGGWVCRYDLARAVAAALAYENPKAYSAFHVVGSWQSQERFDVTTTEQELAIEITQRFENYPI